MGEPGEGRGGGDAAWPPPLQLNEAGPALEHALRAAGLDPDRLEPWSAWRVFKAFARRPVACEGDTVYVQIGATDPTDALLHVTFIRHLAVSEEAGGLEPIREIVCDLAYPAEPDMPDAGVELTSAAFPSLDAFEAAVEEREDFRAAMALPPRTSLVSWSEL